MTLQGPAVSKLGAIVAADFADVADARGHQPREVLRLLVVSLVVVAQLRPVAEASVAHPALVDRYGQRKLCELRGVLALPLGGPDLLQEALLSLSLLALVSHLPGVLKSLVVVGDLLADCCGVESLHVLV